jgi:hypothetical protein
MLSEYFLIFLTTSTIGLLLAAAKMCYKSKCKNIRLCWSCVDIERDIGAELEIDENTPREGEEKV